MVFPMTEVPPPLRVLFVIPGEGQGNSMIFARRQAESLSREGALSRGTVEVECFYLRSRTSPLALVREYFRLRAHISVFQPALVHAHFGTVTAMLAALAAGQRVLAITYRGGDLNWSPSTGPALSLKIRSWVGRLLSQLAALRAGVIICVSEGLRQRLWWRRDGAVVLPSGVDTQLFYQESRDAARVRLGWPLRARVVLFNAGQDARNKRLDLAVAAAAAARLCWPDLRLEILRGEVPPEQVPARMNASDCLLVTSDTEGSPSVIQEALACGVPIVSVDVGDAAERLRGVTHARIVERDAAALGRALAEITAAPLRTNGPAAAGELSLESITRSLCDLYRQALSSAASQSRPGERRVRSSAHSERNADHEPRRSR
jgi:teichuronic acid biosynthesis glycosyltransferase TuaC